MEQKNETRKKTIEYMSITTLSPSWQSTAMYLLCMYGGEDEQQQQQQQQLCYKSYLLFQYYIIYYYYSYYILQKKTEGDKRGTERPMYG